MKNYRPYIISIAVLIGLLTLFYFLGEIILPFFIGWILAFMSNPIVERIRKVIKNRNAAVSILLVSTISVIVGIVVLFGTEIIQDVKRLNNGIQIFISDHEQEIDEGNQQIKSYIESIYSFEELEQEIQTAAEEETDSLAAGQGVEELQSALSGLTSFLGSSDSAENIEEETGRSLNWIIIFFSSLGYFIYILFTYDYFQEKMHKYFDSDVKKSNKIAGFISDFKRIFLDYFRQRSKIVGINFLIFLTTFLILDLPGAMLVAVLAAALTYIAHFHYLALIPLSLSCWIVSMETNESFFLFFGVIGGVFILVSVLEELLMYPRFMKKYDTLNPAIMLVSFSVWTYLFGNAIGTLIALPLTTVMLIYLDRLLLYLKANVTESNNQE